VALNAALFMVGFCLSFFGGLVLIGMSTWWILPAKPGDHARRIHKSARRRILAENRREIMRQKTGE